ncbi:MAG: hypothetical protein ABSA93_07940 [Streptosporangiaceae bacterium]|jgi:hypothetical protein
MPAETDEIVRSIGLELVSRMAPEELPLYPSLADQFQDAKRARKSNKSSDDQILGFGAGEVVTLLTPVILSFTRSFWDAILAQAAQTALHGVLQQLQAHRPGQRSSPGETPHFTEAQIRLLRKVAEQEAGRLNVSKKQAGLLANAIVGVLVAPPVP